MAWFAARMASLGPWGGGAVAVAVSGGADSLALACLVNDWQRMTAADRPAGVLGLVVDHGLRAESRAEARQTGERLARLGIPFEILVLEGLHRGPGLAARARAARYAVLAAACRRHGIVDLLLGHHRDDQAETVAMRLSAGSGIAGLAGMAMVVEQRDLRLVRPLLDRPAAALRVVLQETGIGWVEDPSNADPRATRVRWRAVLRASEEQGAALVARAGRAARVREADGRSAAVALAHFVRLGEDGVAWIGIAPERLPPSALAMLVRVVGGGAWPPGEAAVSRFASRAAQGATLGGARLQPSRAGWWLVREAADCAGPSRAVDGLLWDRRFRLCWPHPSQGAFDVGALGEHGLPMRRGHGLPPLLRRQALPALFAGERPVAVPHLGWAKPGFETVEFRAAWTEPLVRQPLFFTVPA